MTRDKIYVSTDVETDGPILGPYSMLSFASAAYLMDKTLVSTFSRFVGCDGPGTLNHRDRRHVAVGATDRTVEGSREEVGTIDPEMTRPGPATRPREESLPGPCSRSQGPKCRTRTTREGLRFRTRDGQQTTDDRRPPIMRVAD
jgi:hypothetical protein